MAIRTSPEDAKVVIDGNELRGNAFEYGRWIGNTYHLTVSAPGYQTEERTLDVDVAGWAGLVATPLAWAWLGELPAQLYVELQPNEGSGAGQIAEGVQSLEFDAAIRQVTNQLLGRIKQDRINERRGARARFVSDPVIDSDSGEVFEISRRIEQLIEEEAQKTFPSCSVSEMRSQNIDIADYVITGIMPLEQYDQTAKKMRRLSMSVLDRKSGRIEAHASVWITNVDLKLGLTPIYRDSPTYLKDKRIEAQIATARAEVGAMADAEYFKTLTTTALINEAASAYNRGDYEVATALFLQASQRADGDVLRTWAGLHQSYFKRGLMEQAGTALAMLVSRGLLSGVLGMRFIFTVDGTEFFQVKDVLADYQMWLREIARKIQASANCLEIVGHASVSGTTGHNEVLAENRATTVYDKLRAQAPGIEGKLTHSGRGDREGIVKTGANDATDAIDRRVEFRVSRCGTE